MNFSKIKKLSKGNTQDLYHLTVGKNHNFFANGICVHNCDYRGEVGVILRNDGKEPFAIKAGDRIAQMVVKPVLQATFDVVDELSETDRGEGGFGSTGVSS